MSELILASPLQGWVTPLSEVPDPVFAQGMMGEGLAIDPTLGELRAPCDGVVIGVPRTRHAVTLRAANGAELLIHIGLETVALGGEGFTAHVSDGQAVRQGDLLIRFDLDGLAHRARSLLTPVILTNPEAFAVIEPRLAREIVFGEPLMTLRPRAATANTVQAGVQADAGGAEISRSVVVRLAHGLHARPAARLAALAQTGAAPVTLQIRDKSANARSAISILTLGVRCGDVVLLSARGDGAQAAVDALAELIDSGMGELTPAGRPQQPTPAPAAAPSPMILPEAPPGALRGVKAAPGLAIGVAARLIAPKIAVDETSRGPQVEGPALDAALVSVGQRLAAQAEAAPRHQRAILGAHLAFLEDPDMVADARARVAEGASAGVAWRSAIGAYVETLRGVGDARLAERVDDLLDLERQVLLALSGETERGPVLPRGAILLADDLLPSQLIGLDPERIAGLCTANGGPTSHVAILAAAMNLPAIVAAGPGVAGIAEGVTLILDADAGLLTVGPAPEALETAQHMLAARRARREAALAAAQDDCRMADGVRIEVFANLGSVADANLAVRNGAEGCGLLRTEFLFMDRPDMPSEDEQAASYQAIAEALGARPMIVRTLDVGGDKPLDYLPIPPEENPALGLRGLRVGFWRPDLLRSQVRAILRVAPASQCKIMVPMVASVSELLAVRAVVDEVRAELGRTEPVEVGIMVETPAAAVTADLLSEHADFLSVGTNDLAQYALAMDRGNPLMAAQVDGLHPAVLRLIARAAEGGRTHERLVGVCGGLASDPQAVPLLIGLGVTELSVAPAVAAEIKAQVRRLTLAQCRTLAAQALNLASAAEVRALSEAAAQATPALDRGAA